MPRRPESANPGCRRLRRPCATRSLRRQGNGYASYPCRGRSWYKALKPGRRARQRTCPKALKLRNREGLCLRLIIMLTRRSAIRFALGVPAISAAIPAWAFSSKEFWESKPSSEWNAEEVERMITKSPWAKDASVTYNGGPGGLGGNGGGMGRSRGGLGF